MTTRNDHGTWTIHLTMPELADLLGAIDTSIGEGQEGTKVARALDRQGIKVGPEARDAIAPRPTPPCSCLLARSEFRAIMLAPTTPIGTIRVRCSDCGKVFEGSVT